MRRTQCSRLLCLILHARGVRLETPEAVALACELLARPSGIPTAENVWLGSDGAAACISGDGIPSVADVAHFLLTLLPAGTPNVPAALRYAIARGLGTVEAPPFASLEEFSKVLERFEKGDRRDVLRGVLQRGARQFAPSTPLALAATHGARRASGPSPMPPTFTSVDGETESGPHSSGAWAVAAAVALVASFGAGFLATQGHTNRRDAATPGESASASPRLSTETPSPNESSASSAAVQLKNDIVWVPDRTGVVPAVRATSGNAFSPAFASNGTAIFFHNGRARDERSAIEVATAGSRTGGDLAIMSIVDDGSRNYHPQPSPDGRFVAFDSDRDGERGIYVANRDGSLVRRVSGPGYAAVPTWSRDNEWLTYIRAEADAPTVWNLWMQPAAGGSARRLTNHRYGQTWAASWFPDNRRIAYSHEDTLIVLDVQTGEATRYRTPVKGQLLRTPAVSPDGTMIVFQVFRNGGWLLDLADGSMQRVLTDPTAEEFSWSPDGRRVAFHSRRDGQWGIYLLLRDERASR